VKIEFPNREAINSETGGMNFPAIIDSHEITCKVSQEALQDIVPENRTDSVEKQFTENRKIFEDIAIRKIEDGKSDIFITSSDIN
jgi:hypothetical protein